MNKNKVLFEGDMLRVKNGMKIVYDAVTGTLGAAGKNVMFRDWSTEPVVTNDGYTIAEMIRLEDEAEAMGADFIKQALRRQNFEAGDGTTTVAELAYSMIDNGLNKVSSGMNAMKLKREMNESVEKIISKLKESAKKIENDKELFDVANLSMENPSMAKIVVEAVKSAGEHGRVVVQESNGVETLVEEVKGIEFARGYIADIMITNPIKLSADIMDVQVLVTDKEFTLQQQLLLLMNELAQKGQRYLVLLCKGLIGEALAFVTQNIREGKFFCVGVQLPEDEDVIEDICVLTGARKVLDITYPNGLEPAHVNFLGKAKRVSVSREKTVIDGNSTQKNSILDRIKAIKNEIKDKKKVNDNTGRLEERLAKLDGKSIYIKVGATTQQEMKYTKLKVDDAVASATMARKGGVVVGGGRALYDMGQEMIENDGDGVIKVACMMPMRKIIENSHQKPDDILATLKIRQAYNVMTEKPVRDFIKEGIIDPVDVEIWALKNAVSTATGFITSFAAITNVIPKKCCDAK